MFFRKSATLALRLGRATVGDMEGTAFRANMWGSAYPCRSFSYLVSHYQPSHLDLSSASSSTLEASLLSQETANAEFTREAESQLDAGDLVRVAEYQVSVDGEGRSGNVSLHSTMQSNVPDPYNGRNRSPSHLNMPRGVVGRLQEQRRNLSGARIQVDSSD